MTQRARRTPPTGFPWLLAPAILLIGAASSGAATRNLVPNPNYTGALGVSVGATGVIPDLWRGFAVGGGAAQVSVVPVAAGELFPGSSATNAVRLEITAFGADQGFDHNSARMEIVPDQLYGVEIWVKSGNAGGASQGINVGFPLFTGTNVLGPQPGAFSASATASWTKLTGPTFSDNVADNAFVSIRLANDGADNAVLVALPRVAGPVPLFTAGRSFGSTDRWVATTVFHWYTAAAGQLSGPWRPLGGRASWTGEKEFWMGQLADMMDAGVDVLYVHQIPVFESQRINLFRAIEELRAQGWDPPRVVPFLDPLITWNGAAINLAAGAGKDAFVAEYVKWFKQYFAANSDADAESYLAHLDGKVVLDTWHCNPGYTDNVASLSRSDVETRLSSALAAKYPGFGAGVYMIGSVNGLPPPFADEVMHQFSTLGYFLTHTHSDRRVATLNGGVWDQNVRDPGNFLPRDGGDNYAEAWNDLLAARDQIPPIRHAYLESWNEYDEGSGIYEGDPGPPYIAPANTSGNDDDWSTTDNPREYIDQASAGSRAFNDIPDLDARFLFARAPSVVAAGQPMTLEIVARNEGDLEWSAAADVSLGQNAADSHVFGSGRHAIDDDENEVVRYGGVFRGRPVRFTLTPTAPATPGWYETRWQMVRENGGTTFFGDSVKVRFYVCGANPAACPLFADGFESGDTGLWSATNP